MSGRRFERGVTVSLVEPNDIVRRADEDVALLASLGISRIRLSLDWAVLQPRPGRLDDDWRERFSAFIELAGGAGITVDAGLGDGARPGWFEDEGGFGDRKAAGKWWPRWVEIAAESFGDQVGGWIPMARPLALARPWRDDQLRYLPAIGTVAIAWRDAWRILQGTSPITADLGVRVVRPVDETIPARNDARIEDHFRWRLWLRALRDGMVTFPEGGDFHLDDLAGSVDIVGISCTCDAPLDRPLSDELVGGWEHRLGSMLRRVAEEGPDRPTALTLSLHHTDDDDRRHLLAGSARAVVDARDDGVPLVVTYLSPGIDAAAGSREGGLIDRDRNVKGSGTEWLNGTPSE